MSRDNDALAYGEAIHRVYNKIFPPVTSASVQHLVDLLPPSVPATVIEIGVGTGRVLLPLEAALNETSMDVGNIVGVDISSDVLSVLREQISSVGSRVVPVLGDGRSALAADRFGLVMCVCVCAERYR